MNTAKLKFAIGTVNYVNIDDILYAIAESFGLQYQNVSDNFHEHCDDFSYGDSCMTLISRDDFIEVLHNTEQFSDAKVESIRSSIPDDVYINLEAY